MNGKSFFLIVVLLTICSVNSFDLLSLPEIKSISNTDFGKNLIQTMSLSLSKAGDANIDQMKKLLEDLLAKLTGELSALDNTWAIESKRLNDAITKVRKELEDTKTELALTKKELEDLIVKFQEAKKRLEEYHNHIKDNKLEIEAIKEKRAKDAAEYQNSQDEHNIVIEAIDQVVKILQKLIGSISGNGRPEHVQEIAEETRDQMKKAFIQMKRTEEEADLFVQLATKADQAALEKLITLLLKLKVNTEKSKHDDEADEVKSKSTFEKLLDDLTLDIANLDKLAGAQALNIEKYNKQKGELEIKVGELEKLVSKLETDLKLLQEELAKKEAEYKKNRAEMESEIEVVKRLQVIVNERLAKTHEFLSNMK